MDQPGYVIQVLKKYQDGIESYYETWGDLFLVSYNKQETAKEELDNYIKRNNLLQKEDKVVYEVEI
jgi:hypothetical protein